jgi:hypothetical protein
MPQDIVAKIPSDIDLSTVPDDRRPSASRSVLKNPQRILANRTQGFLGLCRIWQHLLRLIMKGDAGQAPSLYNPKYLLIKMPYRFNTSYQLLARSSENPQHMRCYTKNGIDSLPGTFIVQRSCRG